MTSRGEAPALTFGSSLLWPLAAVSAAIALAGLLAPGLPDAAEPGWALVQRGLESGEVRSVPSWWMSVLLAVAALACHAQAMSLRGRRRRTAAVAWWVLALAMVLVSVDHALVLHHALPWLVEDQLPGVVGRRPVEIALLVVVAPAAVVVWATGSRVQRGLLVAAAVAYLAGQVGVDRLSLDIADTWAELAESVLQWTGAILLLAAAGSPSTGRRWS